MIADEWDAEKIKSFVVGLEQWFMRNGGDEEFLSTDPYHNDLKDGLKLCRRFKNLIDKDETDLVELNDIYTGLKRSSPAHGWIDLRGIVVLWRDRVQQQLKAHKNV